MPFRPFLCTIVSFSLTCTLAMHIARSGSCQPFSSTFPVSSVSSRSSSDDAPASPFVAISPEGSYRTGNNGLELFLQKPDGHITTRGGVNDKVADGATINSTFTLLYGNVTYEVSSPLVAGVVTTVILIADERDEIDVELLGGDPPHWQTNVFAPSPEDKQPLWGVFSTIEDVPAAKSSDVSINDFHKYSIDWSADRIVWGVDGKSVRTISREHTRKNGALHYPSHPARVQLGIWDASTPVGTAEWANGPIDWDKAPEKMTAIIRSVKVECPRFE